MNGVEEITMTKHQAAAKYKEYLSALETHNLPYLKELKDAYRQLSRGHGVIDVFKAFRSAGLGDDGEPRLALCPANWTQCYFHKQDGGGGAIRESAYQWSRKKPVIEFGSEFFCVEWPKQKSSWGGMEIIRQNISCRVPIVPAHLLPKTDLGNFHILWEVDKWNPEPPKDPILLKRISLNMFAVVAKWDLTELERAVIAGRVR
jgi:hypothetical protein